MLVPSKARQCAQTCCALHPQCDIACSGVKVLLVEGNNGDANLFRALISDGSARNFHIEHQRTLSEAIQCLQNCSFDVAVVDLDLPDSNGSDTITRIRESSPSIPLVIVTAMSDQDFAVHALENNLVDEFLLKGIIDGEQLTRALRYAMGRRLAATRLTHLAHCDPLTGLSNRALFDDRLQQALARSARSKEQTALLFIDLDRFKQINDEYGHAIGDHLLIEIARRCKSITRECDTIARLGGDEFAVILEGVHSVSDAQLVADKIIAAINKPVSANGNLLHVGCSIGIAMYPIHATDATSLTRYADTAMYTAKRDGGGFRTCGDHRPDTSDSALVGDWEVREAIRLGQFQLHYQPVLHTTNGAIAGTEALLRWRHPIRGVLRPGAFMPQLERSGTMKEVGAWVLNEACQQIMNWRRAGLDTGSISVNVSPCELTDPSLVANVESTLRHSGLAANDLTLEISEHVNHRDLKSSAKKLGALRDMGVRIALDDFGVDQSSFETLRGVQADSLKIDRRFISGLGTNPVDTAVTCSLISLAHHMSIPVIAEGIETKTQIQLLRDNRADLLQGYCLCPPLPPRTLPHWISHRVSPAV